jgi:hypothetical protein
MFGRGEGTKKIDIFISKGAETCQKTSQMMDHILMWDYAECTRKSGTKGIFKKITMALEKLQSAYLDQQWMWIDEGTQLNKKPWKNLVFQGKRLGLDFICNGTQVGVWVRVYDFIALLEYTLSGKQLGGQTHKGRVRSRKLLQL